MRQNAAPWIVEICNEIIMLYDPFSNIFCGICHDFSKSAVFLFKKILLQTAIVAVNNYQREFILTFMAALQSPSK